MRALDWKTLSTAERRTALERPAQRDAARVAREAAEIVAAVRRGGDAMLLDLTERFDGVRLGSLEVSEAEFESAERTLSAAQHRALEVAIGTVRTFHAAQSREPLSLETAAGVRCERISVPVRAAGVQRVFKAGGAQAIAAMAYGTASIPKCDKLYGPGNAWVTAAKLCVAGDAAGAAADLPAGVTEVMVIADESARADFVAADLLAQAEHGAEAQAILVTPSRALAAAVEREIRMQAQKLSRREILASSVREMRLITVDSLDGAQV